jgi:enolase
VLPVPMMNVINGGAHADNSIDLQEFMIVPVGAASFSEALRWGAETYHALAKVLGRGLSTAVGDEGGFAPDLPPTRRPSRSWSRPSRRPGRVPGEDIAIAIDPPPASSTATALPAGRRGRSSRPEMVDYWAELCDRYPIVSIEDGMAEDDWDGWAALTAAWGTGSSSSATTSSSPTRSAGEGHRPGVANAILIKVNQIGTLTETLDTMARARRASYAA